MIKNPNVTYAGTIDKYIGTAYDVVYAVYQNLDTIKLVTTPYIQSSPPTEPTEGMRWFDSTSCRTYIWYLNEEDIDVEDGQWVEDSPQANYKTIQDI